MHYPNFYKLKNWGFFRGKYFLDRSVQTAGGFKLSLQQLKLAGIVLCIFLLSFQNIIIFFRHYFLDYGFPWDYISGYYPVVAYWTSLASQGYIPTWIPFQQMGYPMNLLIQSGIHYPPFWIFPLLKIPYTLSAGAIFQCLHVWFGALGMFFFLRLVFKSNRYALLGAFCFQFFGGFYSNAQHADIMRACTFVPWLFYCFYIDQATQKISWRYFLIPLFIFLLATGGYPGNFISSIFIMGMFVLLQITQLFFSKAIRKHILLTSTFILLMTILGFGLAFYHLGPGWLFRDYMVRSNLNITYQALGPGYIPGLFLNYDVFKTEISMSSSFITIPMVILLAYVPGKVIKKWWFFGVICIFSMLMIAGSTSIVWYLVTKVVPILRISRFPSSDYRILIIIPVICFAVFGAKALIEREITKKRFILSSIIVVFVIAQLIYYSYLPFHKIDWIKITPFVQAMEMLILTSIILLIFYLFPRSTQTTKYFNVSLLIILVAIDAMRVLPNMVTWQAPHISTMYQDQKWDLLDENNTLLTYKILEQTPEQRPGRIKIQNIHKYSWQGYITGRYIYNDKVAYVLKSAYIVDADPVYQAYMELPWSPLLFDSQYNSVNDFSIPLTDFSDKVNETLNEGVGDSVKQTRYGINEISYEISLDEPRIFVENEIYFPGWKAILDYGDMTTEIKAFSTNGVFRSWSLPPGTYQMLATFEFPHNSIFYGLSVASLLIWVLVGILKLNRKT